MESIVDSFSFSALAIGASQEAVVKRRAAPSWAPLGGSSWQPLARRPRLAVSAASVSIASTSIASAIVTLLVTVLLRARAVFLLGAIVAARAVFLLGAIVAARAAAILASKYAGAEAERKRRAFGA